MGDLATSPHLRPAGDEDETFLFEVFSTTWAEEVAALPNPRLAAHVLRIQHTAQERRFDSGYPGFERFVILHDGRRAGRLYVHRTSTRVHALDMTLLPEFQGRGIGTRLITELLELAAEAGHSVTLRVPRRNARATALYESIGFRPVVTDDLDHYLEWSPALTGDPALMRCTVRNVPG